MNHSTPDLQLFENISQDYIGLDTEYELANGKKTRRVYLDSTASTLMMKSVYNAIESFYIHYANTHSLLHFSAKISTQQYQWAHERILSFLRADPDRYTCFFTGSGATAGLNRMARVFRDYRPDKNVALVSMMEHHSNDLPHRKHMARVIHIPIVNYHGQPGCVDLAKLEEELNINKETINYVAVTGVSNVTGIINPIYDIAELSHKYGALILVDGAQMVAHLPVNISENENQDRNIDAFVFSGHKTYVPGSPGVVICRKDILIGMEPEEVGGGMVHRVFTDNYIITDQFPEREEAGTPNIPGAIGLATAIEVMDRIGMDIIAKEESEIIEYGIREIGKIPEVMIYGETDWRNCARTASISFNILRLDHGFTAAVLNDYHNIAVRNECFCAHPYVKELIIDQEWNELLKDDEYIMTVEAKMKAGMVRASFGLYTTKADIDLLCIALKDIILNTQEYEKLYTVDQNGNYIHKSFTGASNEVFSINTFLDSYLNQTSE